MFLFIRYCGAVFGPVRQIRTPMTEMWKGSRKITALLIQVSLVTTNPKHQIRCSQVQGCDLLIK